MIRHCIFKYLVPCPDGVFTIDLPKDARILCVQMQDYKPRIWAVVAPDAPLVSRRFIWADTGEDLDLPLQYIGTIQGDILVFHLFEVP
jgi:hypothetical protein